MRPAIRYQSQLLYRKSYKPNWRFKPGPRVRRVSETRYRQLLQSKPSAAQWDWQTLRRNPRVYARGRVRHSDHATITLPDWHRVVLNTETETETMRNVAFID